MKTTLEDAWDEVQDTPVEPKELHANGEATQDELDAAQADAWWAAWSAARAAEAAAQAKQEAELRRICGEVEG